MKILVGIAILALSATTASAQYLGYGTNRGAGSGSGTGSNPSSHYVQPHVNSNGGLTSGHYQTNPNSTQLDNYGTVGNVNPYNGQVGTRRAPY